MTLGNPGTRKGLPIFAAFIGSFTVYLTPALAVHTGLMPVGIFLLGAFYGLTSGEFVRSVSSILFVLLFQILLGLAIFWTLRGFRWWKSVALVLLLPVLAFALNAGLFIGLPALFLLERDPAPEFGELAEVCQVADAFVLHVTAGVEGALESKGVAWISTRRGNHWAMLSMPDCRVREVGEVKTTSVARVSANGDVLYRSHGGGFVRLSPATPAQAIAEPDLVISARSWQPILSDDGSTLVWLDRAGGPVEQGKVRRHVLRLRALGSGESETVRTVQLELSPRAQITLIGADTRAGRYTLSRFRNEVLAVDGHGRVVWGPFTPNGTYSPRFAFHRLGDGWLAWDSYRDKGRYKVVWSTAGGQGRMEVPKGRTIEHVSVDPSGRFAAVSVRGSVRMISLASALVVLRLSDGKEIYRRFGDPHQRYWPAFLGSEYLAVSDFKDVQAKVIVYRLPAD